MEVINDDDDDDDDDDGDAVAILKTPGNKT